jgi:hypothetical protein
MMSFNIPPLFDSEVYGTEIEPAGLTDVAVDLFYFPRQRRAPFNAFVRAKRGTVFDHRIFLFVVLRADGPDPEAFLVTQFSV